VRVHCGNNCKKCRTVTFHAVRKGAVPAQSRCCRFGSVTFVTGRIAFAETPDVTCFENTATRVVCDGTAQQTAEIFASRAKTRTKREGVATASTTVIQARIPCRNRPRSVSNDWDALNDLVLWLCTFWTIVAMSALWITHRQRKIDLRVR
jgi:hypothetical protein